MVEQKEEQDADRIEEETEMAEVAHMVEQNKEQDADRIEEETEMAEVAHMVEQKMESDQVADRIDAVDQKY